MKKSKPPRIILRRRSAITIRKARDNQSPSSSIYDCEEKNVHVQSGFAFYKKDLEEVEKDEQEQNKETLKQSQKRSNIGDTILPGIADEIESYPCPICNDERVFMTRAGIQKHAENQHQDNYIEVMELAYQIQKEWERRRDTQIAYMDMNPANFAGIEPSLTCDHCNLLFLDEYGLNEHIFLNHNVTYSHSLQKHPNCSICEKSSNLNQINGHTLHLHHYQNGRAVNKITKISSSKQKRSLHQKGEIAAHVHCELCGLAMLRPSLLIRHMIRVHNRSTNFEANITYPSTSALAPLSYCVDRDGNLFWRCCEQEFQNREHLSIHRATYHSMDMEHQQEPIFAHAQSKTSSSATFVPPQQFTQSEYFSINQNRAQQQQDDGFALQ